MVRNVMWSESDHSPSPHPSTVGSGFVYSERVVHEANGGGNHRFSPPSCSSQSPRTMQLERESSAQLADATARSAAAVSNLPEVAVDPSAWSSVAVTIEGIKHIEPDVQLVVSVGSESEVLVDADVLRSQPEAAQIGVVNGAVPEQAIRGIREASWIEVGAANLPIETPTMQIAARLENRINVVHSRIPVRGSDPQRIAAVVMEAAVDSPPADECIQAASSIRQN
jgi:hypothetical protein